MLSRKLASFVEIYGRAKPVEEIPRVDVIFDDLRVNGQSVVKPSVMAFYPEGVPDYANALPAKENATPGVVVEVGKFVPNRSRRSVQISASQ